MTSTLVLVHVQQEHLCEDFWAQHAVFEAGNSGPPLETVAVTMSPSTS